MEPVVQGLLLLIISLAVLLFFGPIIVIISIIGHIELGRFSLDLRDKGIIIRVLVAFIGISVWLGIYIPLISLALNSQDSQSRRMVTQPTATSEQIATVTLVMATPAVNDLETPIPASPETVGTGDTEPNEADGYDMIRVPPGIFSMGNSNPTFDRYDFYPAHNVFLSEFYIDKYEVTNLQYSRCVEAGVCNSPTLWRSNFRENYFGNPEFNNHPVIYVTWNDADTFCRWRGSRLPTEAEWEKAARWHPVENRSTVYPWGNNAPNIALANFNGTDTVEVGSYPSGSSHIGALDMSGNVIEWVADYYLRNYYELSPNRDPQGPLTPTNRRVARGGGWDTSNEADLWTFARYAFEEGTNQNNLGFRCASNSAMP